MKGEQSYFKLILYIKIRFNINQVFFLLKLHMASSDWCKVMCTYQHLMWKFYFAPLSQIQPSCIINEWSFVDFYINLKVGGGLHIDIKDLLPYFEQPWF